MANKVFNIAGGMYSGAAFSAFEARQYGSAVASSDSLKVSNGTGMNLSISAGDAIIKNNSGYGYRIQATTAVTATVSTAPTVSGYSRYDAVVAYVDGAVTPSTSVVDNTDRGILKFKVVSGTAGTNPSRSSADSNIPSQIGASNSYIVLAYVRVPANATTTTAMSIEDARKVAGASVIVSTVDIEEGSYLPKGTIYGVYE